LALKWALSIIPLDVTLEAPMDRDVAEQVPL
jgi:hypothetical protein